MTAAAGIKGAANEARAASSAAKPKRMRTCVGCGAQDDKLRLIRIVRTAEGPVLDATGRVPGRGAYVCSAACLQKAGSNGRLQRALKAPVRTDDCQRLGDQMARLAEDTSAQEGGKSPLCGQK